MKCHTFLAFSLSHSAFKPFCFSKAISTCVHICCHRLCTSDAEIRRFARLVFVVLKRPSQVGAKEGGRALRPSLEISWWIATCWFLMGILYGILLNFSIRRWIWWNSWISNFRNLCRLCELPTASSRWSMNPMSLDWGFFYSFLCFAVCRVLGVRCCCCCCCCGVRYSLVVLLALP